jgi:hypothetical protein
MLIRLHLKNKELFGTSNLLQELKVLKATDKDK